MTMVWLEHNIALHKLCSGFFFCIFYFYHILSLKPILRNSELGNIFLFRIIYMTCFDFSTIIINILDLFEKNNSNRLEFIFLNESANCTLFIFIWNKPCVKKENSCLWLIFSSVFKHVKMSFKKKYALLINELEIF